MLFAQDRDLLTFEPNLFRDVAWVGQQLARGEARLESGHAVFESGSINRNAAKPGMILLVGRLPLEIIEIVDDGDARVSLVRIDSDADPIEPPDAAAAPAICTTFQPQLAAAHRQIIAMLGLEPEGSQLHGALAESAITNPRALIFLECFGALHLIFAGIAAITGLESAAWQKAEMYRDRYAQERWRVYAGIDLNGDGQPDVARRANLFYLNRL